jgi:hypothetical protein
MHVADACIYVNTKFETCNLSKKDKVTKVCSDFLLCKVPFPSFCVGHIQSYFFLKFYKSKYHCSMYPCDLFHTFLILTNMIFGRFQIWFWVPVSTSAFSKKVYNFSIKFVLYQVSCKS